MKTMTTMKKLFALMLAVLMLLSVCAVAGAEDKEYDITGHQFTAYQIFSGNQGESTDGTAVPLTDIEWGTGIIPADFLTALKAENDVFMETGENGSLVNAFAGCETAQDVADVLAGYEHDSDEAKKFAQIAYAYKTGDGQAVKDGEKLNPGYYLIADTTEFGDGTTDNAYNAALLQVTDTINIQVKTSVPTVEKKIKDVNDSETDSTTDWQDSADYDIGDIVPYQLTATLGDELEYYDTYKIEFVDELTEGLTFKEITSVKVAGQVLLEDQYTFVCTNNVLTITINDVLALGAKEKNTIVVEYNAELNKDAEIGAAGNPNTVYLKYSNNPNDVSGMGETKRDKVTVFTYQLNIEKTDSDGKPLKGAAFELFKKNERGEYDSLGTKEAAATTSDPVQYIASWDGLDDGDYKLVETKTPENYNSIKDIEFTISANHDETSENPQLTELSGNATTGSVEFVTDENKTALSTTIVNKSGATLPETGGIGTTIFYVAGGMLVLLAVVLLVTKRRMGENN